MKGCWLVLVNVLFLAYLPSILCLNKCTEVCLKYYILLGEWCIRFIAPSLIILFFCSFVHIRLFLDDRNLFVPSLLIRCSFFIFHRTNLLTNSPSVIRPKADGEWQFLRTQMFAKQAKFQFDKKIAVSTSTRAGYFLRTVIALFLNLETECSVLMLRFCMAW